MTETTWFTWKTLHRGKCADVDALIHPHVHGFEHTFDMPALRADVLARINSMLAYNGARTDGETIYGPADTAEHERGEIATASINAIGLGRILARRQKQQA
jgi:hypothetical protein